MSHVGSAPVWSSAGRGFRGTKVSSIRRVQGGVDWGCPGRRGRLVRRRCGKGVKWEARNASGVGAGTPLETINVHERSMFLEGTKLIAVISEAASAGVSLHADKCGEPPLG
jgi:C-terminal domain on Strawberry notch homologue